MAVEPHPGGGVLRRRRVVRRREPAVGDRGHGREAAVGAPAAEPHLGRGIAHGGQRARGSVERAPGRGLTPDQRAHHRHRLVEARPPLREGDADRVVVRLARPGAEPADHAAAGQDASELRVFATTTGWRTTGSAMLVARAIAPASPATAASAVGPSSHGAARRGGRWRRRRRTRGRAPCARSRAARRRWACRRRSPREAGVRPGPCVRESWHPGERCAGVVESATIMRQRHMQLGIFTVGDVTPDPTTGRTPTEHERIKATIAIATKAEEVGLDVVARRRAPQPAVHRLGARPRRSPTSAAQTSAGDPVDGDDADHDHRPGADRGELRQAPAPHRRPRRPDDGPRQHRPGLPVVRQGHPRGHQPRDRELRPPPPPLARGRRGLGGQVPYAAPGLHVHAAAAGRRTAVRVARLDPLPRDRRAGGVLRRRVLRQPHLLAGLAHRADGRRSIAAASSTTATAPPTRRSSASAARSS